jgi:hypothetical protein
VIPTMLLVGLVFGRWWWLTIPLGTLAWVVLLIVTGVGSGIPFALGAAAFGAANVIVGVLAYQGIAWLIRGFVRTRRPAQQG